MSGDAINRIREEWRQKRTMQVTHALADEEGIIDQSSADPRDRWTQEDVEVGSLLVVMQKYCKTALTRCRNHHVGFERDKTLCEGCPALQEAGGSHKNSVCPFHNLLWVTRKR